MPAPLTRPALEIVRRRVDEIGRLGGAPLFTSDGRSTSDVRAHLQSHGLGGVQKRHYDRHEYALEKRSALELWVAHLERLRAGKVAAVVPIGHRRARRGQSTSLGWPAKDTH